jgi:hypothetical protein
MIAVLSSPDLRNRTRGLKQLKSKQEMGRIGTKTFGRIVISLELGSMPQEQLIVAGGGCVVTEGLDYLFNKKFDLLLGRKTYEIFAG